MTPDRRYPERIPQRRAARDARVSQRRRYSSGRPLQSTKAVTVKLAMLAVIPTLAIGGSDRRADGLRQGPGPGPEGSQAR